MTAATPLASTTPPPPSGERLHALDALRAIALLLGVVLHSAMSFLPSPVIPIWIVADNQPTPVMGAVFFAIHLFRMAAFFLIAGYFANLLLERINGLRPPSRRKNHGHEESRDGFHADLVICFWEF